MIVGVGTDLVKISRFERIAQYPHAQLRRMFDQTELDYAYAHAHTAAKLAVRFAAKEAFFKAAAALSAEAKKLTLMRVLSCVGVRHHASGQPYLSINWQELGLNAERYDVLLSLSDDGDYALAYVVIQEKV